MDSKGLQALKSNLILPTVRQNHSNTGASVCGCCGSRTIPEQMLAAVEDGPIEHRYVPCIKGISFFLKGETPVVNEYISGDEDIPPVEFKEFDISGIVGLPFKYTVAIQTESNNVYPDRSAQVKF